MRRRGITLIELAIVLAIIGILVAITVASLGGLKSRTSFNAAANQVVSEVRRTRLESLNRGTYTVFVIDANTQNWYGAQTNTPLNNPASVVTWLTTFAGAPAACNAAPGCLVFTRGQLPDWPSAFFPNATHPGTAYSGLPAPLSAITSTTACNFCMTTTPVRWGAVAFAPGGSVTFSVDPGAIGGQFTMNGERDTVAAARRIKTVAIVSRDGLIEAYDKP